MHGIQTCVLGLEWRIITVARELARGKLDLVGVQEVRWDKGGTVRASLTRKETSSEACQGRARFQQSRDASCHQVSFPAGQGAEGNSRHSDRNISLFPFWSG